jgi:hypothetical protein
MIIKTEITISEYGIRIKVKAIMNSTRPLLRSGRSTAGIALTIRMDMGTANKNIIPKFAYISPKMVVTRLVSLMGARRPPAMTLIDSGLPGQMLLGTQKTNAFNKDWP